jgi:hypothetical protein
VLTARSTVVAFGDEPNFLAPAFPFPRFLGVPHVLDLELAACFTLPPAAPSLAPNAGEPPCHLRLCVGVHVAEHIPWLPVRGSTIYCSASPPRSYSSSPFGLRWSEMAGAPPDRSTVRLRHRHVSSSNPAPPSSTSLGPSRHGEYVGALAIAGHLTAGEESAGDAPSPVLRSWATRWAGSSEQLRAYSSFGLLSDFRFVLLFK